MTTDLRVQLQEALSRRRELEQYIHFMEPCGDDAAEQLRVAQKELEEVQGICVDLAERLR